MTNSERFDTHEWEALRLKPIEGKNIIWRCTKCEFLHFGGVRPGEPTVPSNEVHGFYWAMFPVCPK